MCLTKGVISLCRLCPRHCIHRCQCLLTRKSSPRACHHHTSGLRPHASAAPVPKFVTGSPRTFALARLTYCLPVHLQYAKRCHCPFKTVRVHYFQSRRHCGLLNTYHFQSSPRPPKPAKFGIAAISSSQNLAAITHSMPPKNSLTAVCPSCSSPVSSLLPSAKPVWATKLHKVPQPPTRSGSSSVSTLPPSIPPVYEAYMKSHNHSLEACRRHLHH